MIQFVFDKETIEEFYKSYKFLSEHPMFIKKGKDDEESKSNWRSSFSSFQECLDIDVVKVNRLSYEIDEDEYKNTLPQVWLEAGPKLKDGTIGHDIGLDTGADTFEEAIINLAKLVKKVYGDYTKYNIDDFNRIHNIFEETVD